MLVGAFFGVLVGFGVGVDRGVFVFLGVLVGFGVLVTAGMGVLVGRGEIGVLVSTGIGVGVSEASQVMVGVDNNVLVGVGLGLGDNTLVDVGLELGVALLQGVGNVLPGRLVLVNEMGVFVSVAVGVWLGPVMGISNTRVAVFDGAGVSAKKINGDFVGVKKSLANASWVKA